MAIPSKMHSSNMELSEKELIERIRAGDESAFEIVYSANYSRLVSFANGYVGSSDISRDIVADVFFKIWQQRSEWEPRKRIDTYLCGAVRNRALNYVRDEKFREGASQSRVLTGQGVPGMGEPIPAVDTELESRELIDAMWRAIELLPPNRREAMMLRWREHKSFDEIAEIMGTTNAAVQITLSRALKTLRDTFPKAFEEVS